VRRRGVLLPAAVLAGTLVPSLAAQQRPWQWEAALSGVGMRVNSRSGPTTQRLSGAVFGLQGQVLFHGRVSVDLGYWQGQLDPASTNAATRDVAEGYALIGARPLDWLTLRAGPHVWTYISNAGTQRWFLWEGRAKAQAAILPDVHSYLELWDVLSANVNVPQSFASGLGGEGGLILRIRDVPAIPAAYPVRIRLGYGIERVRLGDGVRTEIVDHLSLSLSLERH
jgi:hypothetical protein